LNLEGYFESELKMNYYLCTDSTCQFKSEFRGFDILNMNYMKILLTNPDLEGNIIIDEMVYMLNS
jgi:hypothetical protein